MDDIENFDVDLDAPTSTIITVVVYPPNAVEIHKASLRIPGIMRIVQKTR